jgi:hypothetical protein
LVDTRATVTLVSVKLFESMTSAMMTGMKREILTASRSKINVFRKTIIDIDINGYVCLNVATEVDINVDGILGLDFMLAFNPFTLAFIAIPASLANLLTPIEPLL